MYVRCIKSLNKANKQHRKRNIKQVTIGNVACFYYGKMEDKNMILEIGKTYVRDFYNGNLEECIKERDGIDWTQERIRTAFNGGNGTEKDLRRYMDNNKQYAYFVTV